MNRFLHKKILFLISFIAMAVIVLFLKTISVKNIYAAVTTQIVVQDTFTRANQTFWGTSSDGHAYNGIDANNINVFSINSNTGQVVGDGTGNTYNAIVGPTVTDAQVYTTGRVDNTYQDSNFGPTIRWQDDNNFYKAFIGSADKPAFASSGCYFTTGTYLMLIKRQGGNYTVFQCPVMTLTPGTQYAIRFQVVGNTLSAKVWPTSGSEPGTWTVTATDNAFSSGRVGIRTVDNNGAITHITSFIAYSITPLVSGNLFVDTNNNGTKDAGESSYTGANATIKVTNGTTTFTRTTDASGNYAISDPALESGTWSVSLKNGTIPAGYTETTGTTDPQSVTFSGINSSLVANFGISNAPTYTICGRIYNDSNTNQTFDTGDTNNNNATSLTIKDSGGNSVQTVSNVTGTYCATNLVSGQYSVIYNGPPTGYYMSYPQTGTPPTFTVTVGPSCSQNANDASCSNGNITNLDFGIIQAQPWIQSFCGDIRQDSGITNSIPPAPVCGTTTGAYMIQSQANVCTNPGIAFSGNTTPNFGSTGGQASSTNWIVGTTQYPSVLKATNVVHTSYAYMLAKMRQSGTTAVDLATKCTLTNCTLPANLPHGLYQTNGNVNLQGYTFPANQDYVFLINGKLTLSGNISIPVGATVLFSSGNDIEVANTVGTAATSTTSNLDGFYSADRSFIIDSTGTCPDLRLNIAGSVIVNAGQTGGTFTNNRDLCTNNSQCPSIAITQRPDLILNSPMFVKYTNHVWKELAPGAIITSAPTPIPTTAPTAVPTTAPTAVPTTPPTEIPTPTTTYLAQDTFQRANQSTGWGTASDGHVWGADATNSTFSISNNAGKEANGGGTTYTGILGSTAQNVEVLATGSLSSFAGSPPPNFGPVVRYTDANNWYKAFIDGSNFYIQEKVSGTATILTSTAFSATAGTAYSIRFQATGTTLNAKVWQSSQSEPSSWTLTTTDNSLTGAGNVGIRLLTTGSDVLTITYFQAMVISTTTPIPTPTTTYLCANNNNCSYVSTCSVNNQLCYCFDGSSERQYQCTSGSWAYQKNVSANSCTGHCNGT